ncbi:MAG: hypothetical protein FWD14_07515 [Treponema sp.]|nr:hypothetical protein [Treponema sp.]
MKKLFFVAAIFVCFFGFGINVHAQQINLNNAIQNAASELSAALTVRSARVAVLPVHSETAEMTEHLTGELITALINQNMPNVISKIRLNEIFGDRLFNMSGEIDDTTALTFGRFLNVQYIVTGSFIREEETFRLNVRIIEVTTALSRREYNALVLRDAFIISKVGEQKRAPFSISGSSVSGSSMSGGRNNWLSFGMGGGLDYFGFGYDFRYDRKINNFFHLGGSIYTANYDLYGTNYNYFGISAIARIFPGKREVFYSELGLGYGSYKLRIFNSIKDEMRNYSGLMLSPAIGWKVGGNNNGLFADLFVGVPFIKGSGSYEITYNPWNNTTTISRRDGKMDDFGVYIPHNIGLRIGYAW